METEVLANATLIDGRTVDITVGPDDSGRLTILAVADHAGAVTGDGRTDLTGHLLSPAPVEPHAHLDKAFLAESVPNPTGDLMGAIEAMQRSAPWRTRDHTVERATRAARLMAANGYVAVRTHVDVTLEDGLTNAEALVEMRQLVADEIDVEIVALLGMGFTGSERSNLMAMLHDALDLGVDMVGGCPHLEPDQRVATDALVSVAANRGVGIDLHTDETLDPTARGLDLLVDAVEAGFELPVTASHCVALGQRDPGEQRAVAERVAAAGISVVALPATNLYLQGRNHNPVPRGLTAVEALRAAGVNLAAGADNIQDPFNPMGRASPFETAGLMILAAHLTPEEALDTVTARSAHALGRPAAIAVGAPAAIIAIPASTIGQAIATEPPIRRWFAPSRVGAVLNPRVDTDSASDRSHKS